MTVRRGRISRPRPGDAARLMRLSLSELRAGLTMPDRRNKLPLLLTWQSLLTRKANPTQSDGRPSVRTGAGPCQRNNR